MAISIVTTASGASWQEVAKDRQRHRDGTIAAVQPAIPDITNIPLNTLSVARQVLTPDEIKITEATVEDLLTKLAKGELSSTEVTNAFLRRAGLAQKVTNCITELLPQRALSRAKYLDEYLKTNGKTLGPLHGLPISVKEHVGIIDLDHNAGFVAWVGKISPVDSHIVEILLNAGAVLYARTTQPQSLMHLETSNNIYGVTVNPFNTTLTCGGSSGGEGALIGFRGSCLGIGTDIGGSIRSPAANNGLYGMKPTTRRLPVEGWAATMAGSEHILGTIGPLSTSLEGCKIFIKTLIDAKPWYKEPSLLPFPWKEEDLFSGKKLKVAILWDDGVVKPHPPVTRALQQVVDKLKTNDNIEVVEWKPYKHDLAWDIIANLYFSDGGQQELDAIKESGEPLRPLTEHIITQNQHVQSHSIASMWNSQVQRDNYRTEYANLWNETATSKTPSGELEGMVDVILSPVGPGSAPKLDTAKWWGYTSQWNLLDYPAIVFPVDKVDVTKDNVKETYTPRNDKDKYNWDLWEQYGAEGYKDAPISLQLIGRRYEEEKVIQALEIIQGQTGLPFVEYI
ncbi:41e683fe-58ed-426e-beb6-afdce751dde1 [Sclerotinia trifoliorum]|uniref:amidase n=1 Tax=Sclerotinia trifoliorum TaxID=28548 RepID=A0A8H2VWL1_9HELO|nr:41e683fe-58ed-426e-beb6-afdce751dde1 [Sclerotinia trifoliorum]